MQLVQVLRRRIFADASGQGPQLLVLSQTARKAHKLASDPRSTLKDMTGLLEKDPVAASVVLKVARSTLYYRGHAVESLQEAIVRIGLEGCRNSVFLLAVRGQIARGLDQEDSERLWRHSVACGAAAMSIAECVGMPKETAFLAGLLHDIGRAAGRAAFTDLCRLSAKMREVPKYLAEQAVDELHVAAGTFLLSRWGLAKPIVEAVAMHHDPPVRPTLGVVVGCADNMAKETGWASQTDPTVLPLGPYLRALNITPHHVEPAYARMKNEIAALVEMSG